MDPSGSGSAVCSVRPVSWPTFVSKDDGSSRSRDSVYRRSRLRKARETGKSPVSNANLGFWLSVVYFVHLSFCSTFFLNEDGSSRRRY